MKCVFLKIQPIELHSTFNLVSADVWTWSDVIYLIWHFGKGNCFLLQVAMPWNNHKWLFPSNKEESVLLYSNFLSSSNQQQKHKQQSVKNNPNFWAHLFHSLPFLIVFHQLRIYGRKPILIKTLSNIYMSYKYVCIYIAVIVNKTESHLKVWWNKKRLIQYQIEVL